METILVLCTGNSCRSQMAEGYLKKYCNENVRVLSAGIETHGLNPKAVQVMQEDGVDITSQTSDLVDLYLDQEINHVLTVCDNAKESCPIFPQKSNVIHHSFPDPAKASGDMEDIMNEFRSTRDLINNYCKDLVSQLNLN